MFLGDLVDIGGGMSGVVVAVIDDGACASGISAKEWQYLGQGVLLDAPGFGILHYSNAEHDFTLVRRAR
ncbi:hypothetical protein [Stenotrophomonas sp.]|uniref:hypothetical protein n=1 Tax=Stenotrophomonas sp. TaxID=69392 RepID=UPI002D581F42|nr:hypothetical protein [Stenotrophomonas sp.]HYQ23156.1 hypothetical protein [Stenotrophomonas sp.]